MSPFARRSGDEDEGARGGSSDLHVDLDERVCAQCRRNLAAWQKRCPECGGEAVRLADLPPQDDPLLDRFRDDDD